MKTPDDCSNMEDIRSEIDRIDRQIIAAFGTRFGYVKAASKFKTSETSVKAPQRFEAMLQQRRINHNPHPQAFSSQGQYC